MPGQNQLVNWSASSPYFFFISLFFLWFNLQGS